MRIKLVLVYGYGMSRMGTVISLVIVIEKKILQKVDYLTFPSV